MRLEATRWRQERSSAAPARTAPSLTAFLPEDWLQDEFRATTRKQAAAAFTRWPPKAALAGVGGDRVETRPW